MALETGTYISDLVSTNPVSSDNISQGDDHIRLLKSTIKATFPNITGAVTPTHTDLNKLTSSGSPQFSTIELGHASDTTITRSAAGVIAVEGGVVPKENRANTFSATQTISTGASNGLEVTSNNNAIAATLTNGVIALREGSNSSANNTLELHMRPNAGKSAYLSFTENAVSDNWIIGTQGGSTGLRFATGTVVSNTERMRIDSSGNVGIGTTSPSAKLDISGNILFSAANPQIQFNAGGPIIRLPGANTLAFLSDSSTERMRIDSSGNVLVGTTDTSLTSGIGIKTIYSGSTPYHGIVGSPSSNSDTAYHVYSTGAGAFRFYVGYGGTIYATNTTISAISDQRLKENIQDLDAGLNEVLALRPRKFDWKQGSGNEGTGVRGFIAQELEQVFPDLIDEWQKGENHPEDEPAYKSVRQDLIPVLVKAIQELSAKNDALEARIAALEAA